MHNQNELPNPISVDPVQEMLYFDSLPYKIRVAVSESPIPYSVTDVYVEYKKYKEYFSMSFMSPTEIENKFLAAVLSSFADDMNREYEKREIDIKYSTILTRPRVRATVRGCRSIRRIPKNWRINNVGSQTTGS